MEPVWYLPLVLVCLVAFFPEDAFIFAKTLDLKLKLHVLNIRMFFMSYIMYRKLVRDFSAMGLPAPPFAFVPLWKR
jgi:hypothetical protein